MIIDAQGLVGGNQSNLTLESSAPLKNPSSGLEKKEHNNSKAIL